MSGELIRDSRYWNREFEMGLPDCRLHDKPLVYRGHMRWEEVFCGNCGRSGGLVTAEWSPHVFYLCDDCARLGPVDGAQQVSPEREAQLRGN